jgi:3'-phosphoadenosine 5'-phosphosulfate sulfotransferase (PAPS reductase)/FAD synthetase
MNPYRLDAGPSLISFSGGRTSAYMLNRIVDAHDGKLPSHVDVAFANTGKERPETLRFVHECGSRWGVHIHWLEWRAQPERVAARPTFAAYLQRKDPDHTMVSEKGFERVGYNSASRNGEPFAALIAMKQYTPNAKMRFCTEELKVTTLRRHLLDLGWTRWTNVVGLRRDEAKRVHKRRAREAEPSHDEPYMSAFPLFEAGVTKETVDEFWAEQDFDLEIPSYDGNCDACFLKGVKRLMWTERTTPGTLAWWAEQEITGKGRFTTEYSMASLIKRVQSEPLLPMFGDEEERDVECGLVCEP